ncbi:MAG: hypothetical protein GTO41_14820 [Burkholderiales bacterium]|nr:hypothetical protein [Burkholderiales bacterium]
MQKSGTNQFTLAWVFIFTTFACLLFAMISQRSPLGVIAWSLAGAVYSWFVRYLYIRRSLLCFCSGTCVMACTWLYVRISFPHHQPVLTLFGLLGFLLAFSGGSAMLLNLVYHTPHADRQPRTSAQSQR